MCLEHMRLPVTLLYSLHSLWMSCYITYNLTFYLLPCSAHVSTPQINARIFCCCHCHFFTSLSSDVRLHTLFCVIVSFQSCIPSFLAYHLPCIHGTSSCVTRHTDRSFIVIIYQLLRPYNGIISCRHTLPMLSVAPCTIQLFPLSVYTISKQPNGCTLSGVYDAQAVLAFVCAFRFLKMSRLHSVPNS